jgi:hypothetical protein
MKSLALVFVFCLAGCSGNNLFLGEIRATVGTHAVTVTDCYRFRVDPPRQTANGTYEFTPCRDARITIRGEAARLYKSHWRLKAESESTDFENLISHPVPELD